MSIGQAEYVFDVAVVVVTFNSEELLPDFFSSLGDALGDLRATVVVSDNDSQDESLAVARTCWPEAIVVTSQTNRGYAAAINAAVSAAPLSRAILVLNDDIRLGEGSVSKMLTAIGQQDVGIAVPRLVDANGALLKSLRRQPTALRVLGEAVLGGKRSGRFPSLGEVIHDDDLYDAPTRASWASGCAWLIDRSCWDTVGPWDESLFLYAEDIDYALRAGDAGLKIELVPSASAVHLVGPSHENPRLWSMSIWNRYRVYERRHGRLRSYGFWIALWTNEVLRCLARRKIHCSGASALMFRSKRPVEVR